MRNYPIWFIFFNCLIPYDRLPYDHRNLLGYIFTVIIQVMQSLSATMIPLLLLGTFVSCCRFLIAFVRDIEENLNDLSVDLSSQKTLSTQQYIEIKRKLCGIMKLHAEFKQLSFNFQSLKVTLILLYSISELQVKFRISSA